MRNGSASRTMARRRSPITTRAMASRKSIAMLRRTTVRSRRWRLWRFLPRGRPAERKVRARLGAALGALAVVCVSCGPAKVRARMDEPFPAKLSAWGLFTGRLADLKPSARVTPYDLNSPLFSDYAGKQRFVWMPEGTAAVYRAPETLQFPAGTILAKTFSFDERGHIETRLLVNARRGWTPLVYVWNAAQTDARLDQVPDAVAIEWRHPSGDVLKIDYVIPETNQCKGCHDQGLGAAKLTRAIRPS